MAKRLANGLANCVANCLANSLANCLAYSLANCLANSLANCWANCLGNCLDNCFDNCLPIMPIWLLNACYNCLLICALFLKSSANKCLLPWEGPSLSKVPTSSFKMKNLLNRCFNTVTSKGPSLGTVKLRKVSLTAVFPESSQPSPACPPQIHLQDSTAILPSCPNWLSQMATERPISPWCLWCTDTDLIELAKYLYWNRTYICLCSILLSKYFPHISLHHCNIHPRQGSMDQQQVNSWTHFELAILRQSIYTGSLS